MGLLFVMIVVLVGAYVLTALALALEAMLFRTSDADSDSPESSI